MKETCLVTGGSGFIGSHLCELLLQKGYRVVCVDNLSSGRIENINQLKNSKDFIFIKHDIIEPFSPQLQQELKNARWVFHLASPASPNQKSELSYYSKPVETLLVNSYGTYKLLETCVHSGALFLYASSSEVYGDPKMHPQKETYWGYVNPIGERSCYDEAKRFGEAITFAFIRKHGLNARIVRIFNTYGPKMNKEDGRAVVEFITKALSGEPITIFGIGEQTRSFCYVSDMVKGIYKAMFLANTKSQVINLGNPEELTLLEIETFIKEVTGAKSEVI